MVQIATNTPSGLGCRSRNLSREARTLSMSRQAVPNSNQCNRVWDRPRWGSVMRFEDAAVDGRSAQIAAIRRGGTANASSRPGQTVVMDPPPA